ncbi:MAG TPA: NACHT domain-containing protein [Anaerolineaceae bacterium]|nr:NACHT domain-containing protein [Anaerolineaceae bacterium]
MTFTPEAWKAQIAAYLAVQIPQIKQLRAREVPGAVLSGILSPLAGCGAESRHNVLIQVVGQSKAQQLEKLMTDWGELTGNDRTAGLAVLVQTDAEYASAANQLMAALDVAAIAAQTLSEADYRWLQQTLGQDSVRPGGQPALSIQVGDISNLENSNLNIGSGTQVIIQEQHIHELPIPERQNLRQRVTERQAFADYLANSLIHHLAPETDQSAFVTPTHYVELYVRSVGRPTPKPLSRALRQRRERLILLEGLPGSGKSAALQQFVYHLASQARGSINPRSTLPVYINLRDLKLDPEQDLAEQFPVAIKSLIYRALNPSRRPEILDFLNRQYERGLREGSWLFIFDSFDEIPEILKSTHADGVVQKYVAALDQFLHGIYRCRGIIASRHYQGPGRLTWPVLHIQPLDRQQQRELIRKSGVEPGLVGKIIQGIEDAGSELQQLATTPLFLSILCNNIQQGSAFPTFTHKVYDDFTSHAFQKGQQQLQTKFNLAAADVRRACEAIALVMIEQNLGLNPARSALIDRVVTRGLYSSAKIEEYLEALLQLQILHKIDPDSPDPGISFGHRRFQEYYAAGAVIRQFVEPLGQPTVSVHQLVTDGRWREVVVTLLQMENWRQLGALFAELQAVLTTEWQAAYVDLSEHYEVAYAANDLDVLYDLKREAGPEQVRVAQLSLAYRLQHVLGILRDGVGERLPERPGQIATLCQEIITTAYWQNSPKEKMAALEFSGLLPEVERRQIYLDSITKDDPLHKNDAVVAAVIRNASRLTHLPAQIRRTIVQKAMEDTYEDQLWRNRTAARKYAQRLPLSTSARFNLRALFWLPVVDIALLLVSLAYYLLALYPSNPPREPEMILVYLGLLATAGVLLIPGSNRWLRNNFKGGLKGILYSIRIFLFGISSILVALVLLDRVISEFPPDTSWIRIGAGFLMIYGLLLFPIWSPLIVPCIYFISAERGRLLSPFLWLLAPILWIVFIPMNIAQDALRSIQRTRQNYQTFRQKVKDLFSRRKVILHAAIKKPGITLLYVGSFTLAIFMIVYFSFRATDYIVMDWLPSAGSGNSNFTLGGWDIPIIILLALVAVFVGVTYWYQGVRERRLKSRLPAQMDLPTFLNGILPPLKRPASKSIGMLIKPLTRPPGEPLLDADQIFTNPIARVVLREHRLENSDASVRAIRRLTTLIQCAHNLNARSITFTLKPGCMPDQVDEWLHSLQSERRSNVLTYTTDTLDAMCQWLSEGEREPN